MSRACISSPSTEEDLYGDLETSIFSSGGVDKNKENDNLELENQLEICKKEIQILKHRNKQIANENIKYSKNISSLYLTAKNEIEKKNFIIKQLQTKLQQLTTSKISKSGMTKAETEEILRNCQEANKEANSQIIVEELTKTITEMQNVIPKVPGNRKQYLFGNWSIYFYREQVPFKSETRASVECREDRTENKASIPIVEDKESPSERTKTDQERTTSRNNSPNGRRIDYINNRGRRRERSRSRSILPDLRQNLSKSSESRRKSHESREEVKSGDKLVEKSSYRDKNRDRNNDSSRYNNKRQYEGTVSSSRNKRYRKDSPKTFAEKRRKKEK